MGYTWCFDGAFGAKSTMACTIFHLSLLRRFKRHLGIRNWVGLLDIPGLVRDGGMYDHYMNKITFGHPGYSGLAKRDSKILALWVPNWPPRTAISSTSGESEGKAGEEHPGANDLFWYQGARPRGWGF